MADFKLQSHRRVGHQVSVVGAVTAVPIGLIAPHGNQSHLAGMRATLENASTSGTPTVEVSRVRDGVATLIGTLVIDQDAFTAEIILQDLVAAANFLEGADQILADVTAAGTGALDLSLLVVEHIDH